MNTTVKTPIYVTHLGDGARRAAHAGALYNLHLYLLD